MRHSIIRIGEDTVTKTAAPDLMRVEVEKSRRAFAIGRDCGLFRVPEILDYDEKKGVVVFERIRKIRPAVSSIGLDKSTAERIGSSLAIIHQTLSLPPGMIIPLPQEFELPGTDIFLHGDFNGTNVCIDASSNTIVILDWQMTSRHGGQATYGSRYFDLMWFVNYMLWTPRISYIFRDTVTPISKALIKSYFREAGIPYDRFVFGSYAKRFFEIKLPFRKQHAAWASRWLLPRSHVLTERFIKTLKSLEPEEQISPCSGAIR